MDVQGLGSQLLETRTVSYPFDRAWSEPILTCDSHTICTFIFLELHRKAYRQVKGIDEKKL